MDMHQLNFGPRFGISSSSIIKLSFVPEPASSTPILFLPEFLAIHLIPLSVAVQGPNIIDIDGGFPADYLTNFNVQSLAIEDYQAKPNYPTTNNWNLAVQRELPGSTILDVSYVGSKSTHVNAGRDQNNPYPLAVDSDPSANRPFPQPWHCRRRDERIERQL